MVPVRPDYRAPCPVDLVADHIIDILTAHNEKVRSLVPKEQLLEMDLSEGWEPLCKFLGVPVPEGEAFPRMNDAEAADQFATKIVLKALLIWMGILSGIGILGYGAMKLLE